ncbi:uncharacterized protein LOC114725532 [Neltuma alba]|uniref:uncharacterized protein LOC114725532 n=1 Tax=Neltuma alba TaxID=207710 RepID=UPI0010A3F878|nr:uncharacterized protein LOC114725532 [Prosopis alba]
MAASDSSLKSSLHIRSNTLPSAPHPLVSQFEEHLNRLKSSESASSSQSLKLSGLQDLHDCIDKVLQLPITQQDFAREFSNKGVDDLLDGSLRLLDVCSIAKDFLLQSKESLQELQSIIRRRRGAKNGLAIEVGEYLASRKKMKNAIFKVLGSFKGRKMELIVSSSNKENDTLSMLKEAEAVTLSTLETLMSFISDTKGQSKQWRWSAISKLMQPKRVACDSQEMVTNEFKKVDAALKSLMGQKHAFTENFQGDLENLETCIEDLEIGIECLSRKLIKTRVSILNIFNN